MVIEPDDVRIQVRDRGEGVPAEMQAHVFEAFARGTADERGTGLGLTLSRQLARLLGGDLTVRSSSGQGATFVLALPRHGQPPGDA
jgi:signal transduction histidine kinase